MEENGTILERFDKLRNGEGKLSKAGKKGKGKESFTLVGQGTVKTRFTEIFGTWTLLSL